MNQEIKPARRHISGTAEPKQASFKRDPRLELLASQIRAGWPVSITDTLEVEAYMERKKWELGITRTHGELALEITAWICAMGILGLALWRLVT